MTDAPAALISPQARDALATWLSHLKSLDGAAANTVTAYGREDWDFAAANGIRIIPIAEFHARGADDVMAEAREIVGQGETYVTYDIDFVDPTFAPGTGTPEVGGPYSWQALQVARGLRGLNVVGADLVEVSPPFDANGGTAWLGVSLMFEMLCVMAERVAG